MTVGTQILSKDPSKQVLISFQQIVLLFDRFSTIYHRLLEMKDLEFDPHISQDISLTISTIQPSSKSFLFNTLSDSLEKGVILSSNMNSRTQNTFSSEDIKSLRILLTTLEDELLRAFINDEKCKNQPTSEKEPRIFELSDNNEYYSPQLPQLKSPSMELDNLKKKKFKGWEVALELVKTILNVIQATQLENSQIKQELQEEKRKRQELELKLKFLDQKGIYV